MPAAIVFLYSIQYSMKMLYIYTRGQIQNLRLGELNTEYANFLKIPNESEWEDFTEPPSNPFWICYQSLVAGFLQMYLNSGCWCSEMFQEV